MKKYLNQLVKGDIFMIMMISKFYLKQKILGGKWPLMGGKLGGLYAMWGILGVMGPPKMGGSLGTMWTYSVVSM